MESWGLIYEGNNKKEEVARGYCKQEGERNRLMRFACNKQEILVC